MKNTLRYGKVSRFYQVGPGTCWSNYDGRSPFFGYVSVEEQSSPDGDKVNSPDMTIFIYFYPISVDSFEI